MNQTLQKKKVDLGTWFWVFKEDKDRDSPEPETPDGTEAYLSMFPKQN